MAKTKVKPQTFDPFEYVLDDYLEMKAKVNPESARVLKAHLSRAEEGCELSMVEAFRLNGQLVLIGKGSLPVPTQIIFFDSEEGSVEIKEIVS